MQLTGSLLARALPPHSVCAVPAWVATYIVPLRLSVYPRTSSSATGIELLLTLVLRQTKPAMLSRRPFVRRMRVAPCGSVMLLVLVLCGWAAVCVCGGGQSYGASSAVPILVNNVGPFHNPAESYKYYSLPYCEPSEAAPAPPLTSPASLDENLGEVLAGDRRRGSLYDVKYGVAEEGRVLCERLLSVADVAEFVHAIRAHYVFEMFVDELPSKAS